MNILAATARSRPLQVRPAARGCSTAARVGQLCRMIILGPPGGGKGTISSRLVDRKGFTIIGMGDMLRRSQSEEIRDHISRGGALASSGWA